MAQNQGYFQPPPPGQQTQYSPVFQQQPQNIYQQLGKPQPQRTHSFDQQQQQLVPQGFQFAPQQQQYQPPYALSQTPYALSQTPYQPSTTPFSAAPQTFAAQPQYQQSQAPYQQQYVQQSLVPYSVQQQPQLQPAYQQQLQQQVPVQTQMQLQPQPQQYVQQQQQPVYQQQQQQQQLPISSFPNQSTSWRPASSTSSKPPPISPSASLAKQARAPLAIMPPSAPASALARTSTTVRAQVVPASAPVPAQAPPPASVQPQPQPQTPGRRPLPQPVPGGNVQPPTLPAGSALRRPPVLPSLNTNGPSTSFSSLQQQQIQRITSPPTSASPTRSARPLPTPTSTTTTTPGSSSRRSTVDMGKLPHGASAMVPSIGPISSNNSSSTSVSNVAANWPPQNQNRTPSPTKPAEGAGMPLSSRTAGYALGAGGANSSGRSSPTKRRASPPRFHAQSASDASSNSVSGSSSPVKENVSSYTSNANAPYAARSAGAGNTAMGISPSASTSTSSTDAPNNTDATPKKFTPMWRRTIPEMPAPAWGYAAGMVAEPHPKPKPPVQAPAPVPAPAPVVVPVEKEKGKGKLAKLLKRKKSAQAVAPPVVAAALVTPPGAAVSGGPKTLNSQYPPAQVHGQYQQRQQQPQQQPQHHQQQQQQRYANWQPQVKVQTQTQQYAMQNGHQRAPAGYAPRTGMQPQQGQEEEETEEDDDEEEETGEEQTGEEEETEEEETEESDVDHPPVVHARQYSHQSQAPQHQYQQQQHPQASQAPQKQRQGSRQKYDDEYEEEYEDEEDTPRKRVATPKKGVLRAKMSPNATYASYNEASPRRIAEKRAAIEREMEREREREAAPKLRLRPKVSGTRSRALEEAEAEERVLMSGGRRRGVVSQVPLAGDGPSRRMGAGRGHERSRSAFNEREAVHHRREPSEVRHVRRPGSAILAGERRTRRSYDDDEDEDCATLAYDDSEEEEEEEEEEVQYKKVPKRGTPIRDTRERDWHRREIVQHRRNESSPQYGNRGSAPPMNRRSKSGSGADARYEDEHEDEGVEYRAPARRAATTPKAERKYREEEVEDHARRPSGLPHPPSMGRQGSNHDQDAGQRMSASRMGKVKSVPLKQDDFDGQEHYTRRNSPQEKPELSRQFAKMQLRNANGGQGGQGAPTPTDGWPAGLPRLPRTPGSVATPDKGPNGSGGYFDVRPPSNPAPNNFQAREPPKQTHTPSRANLNLDDPPPRATVIRTPSPGPRGGYIFKRELPQPQGPPQVNPSSQNYPVTADKVSEQLARRRSMYTAPPQPIYQQQQAPTQRPQSQIYSNNAPPPQVQQFVNQLGHPPFNNTRMQQTPAPPPTIGIESPHPVGGREKMADIPKMEEDSNYGSDNERPMIPRISFDSPQQQSPRNAPSIPMININSSPNVEAPVINVDPPSIHIESDASPRKQHFDQGPKIQVYEVPGISVSGPQFDDHHGGPVISISDPDDHRGNPTQSRQHPASHPQMGQNSGPRTGGLICGGCHGPIIGRIVSAMGQRYHPACFKCTVCSDLLEHVSSYEHEGRPYCHLDYHETFAPRCFSCKTAIVEEQFISLDDPALGKRAYHAQHFFCAECGDPFLSPSAFPTDSQGEFALSGDGEFEGFTVYKGHPYCEACHVRLRLPKCKRCKKSIRDNDEAVEALGGKWCWGCFVCASCQNPFQDPSFFQRDNQPFCEHCFSVMLRNEV
ncbi:hypothetical protein D9619_008018 [Psilocybe cf. subviscida]|uniref:LIM zinc-binding domain-containing protein n=1 Tax=Psilocybe cf. subviscida TaxID=2480587 RepID=A0A8H5ESK1_9AGAR|nr:hypothetical protein D9619_008018 [Psilocybe cf. subviscida]